MLHAGLATSDESDDLSSASSEEASDSETIEVELQSVWGQKLDWALRTGLACCLAAIYGVCPGTESWASALAFITAVIGTSGKHGPSVGQALLILQASAKGGLYGAVAVLPVVFCGFWVSELAYREAMTYICFILVTFFLVSRPIAMPCKVIACVMVAIETIGFTSRNYTLQPYHPFKVYCSLILGFLAALLAVLVPYPRFAKTELRRRAAFQAKALDSLLSSQLHVILSEQVQPWEIARTKRLVDDVSQNVACMESLLPLVDAELCCCVQAARRTRAAVAYFRAQTPHIRSIQAALRFYQEHYQQHGQAHGRFLKIVRPASEAAIGRISEVSSQIVSAACQNQKEVCVANLEDLEHARKAVNAAVERGRKEVMFKGGSQYSPVLPDEQRALAYTVCVTQLLCVSQLTDAVCKAANGMNAAASTSESKCCDSVAVGKDTLRVIFQCPTWSQSQEAIKKTVALAIAVLLSFIPWLHGDNDQSSTAAITVAFLWTDSIGSSVNSSMQRLVGSFFAGIFGEMASGVIGTARPGIAAALTVWAFGCAFFRGGAHTNQVQVAAYSAAFILLGVFSRTGDAVLGVQLLSLHRLEMSVYGALIYLTVEIAFWPRFVRHDLVNSQQQILDGLSDCVAKAFGPFLLKAAGTVSLADSDKVLDDTQSLHKMVTRSQEQLPLAQQEPDFWRLPFPWHEYERLLTLEDKLFRILKAVELVTGAAVPALLPADAARHVAAFVEEVSVAAADTATLWEKHLRSPVQGAALYDKTAPCAGLRSSAKGLFADVTELLNRIWEEPEPSDENVACMASCAAIFYLSEVAWVAEEMGMLLREIMAREMTRVRI